MVYVDALYGVRPRKKLSGGVMKIYLAGQLSAAARLESVAVTLRGVGHEVVSRWHARPDCVDAAGVNLVMAREDLEDLGRADMLLLEVPSGCTRARGGCWVEFGWALGRRLSISIIGPHRNVFTYLPEIARYDCWAECMDVLVR